MTFLKRATAKRRSSRSRVFAALRALLCAASLATLAGCGDAGPQRYDVAGSVTHGGQSVAEGSIQFEPDAAQGNAGPAGFAVIRQGRFDTRSDGRGTVGGPHRVIINGSAGEGNPASESVSGAAAFPEHRTSADLPRAATTLDFAVPLTAP